MKSYLLILLSLVCFAAPQLKAQEFCATEMPEEMITWLREYKAANPGAPSLKRTSNYTYLPVKFHIVGNDQGGSYYNFNTLLDAFATLNTQYAPYGWQFYIYEDINYINNQDLNIHNGNSFRNRINSESVKDVVNMFFVDDPSGACGYYAGFGGPRGDNGQRQGYIAIQDGQCALSDNSTIAHEIGHFFSLPHTFSGWEGRSPSANARSTDEKVDGSNCGFAGDFFCDTPADYISDRWQCPYTPGKTDFNGDQYQVDGTLYMSYSNDECTGRFSAEQVDAMQSYLSTTRSYMLGIAYPGYLAVEDTTDAVLPVANAQNVPANFANLKWSRIPNATSYYLELRFDSPSPLILLDTVISDTSLILTDLLPFRGYKYRVRAFNPWSTGSPMTPFRIFSTGDTISMKPVINIEQISCSEAFDGAIQVEVNNPSGPVTYNWSNGFNSESISNLSEGNWDVTVTDGVDTVVIDIDLAEPDPINIEFELVGNAVRAIVSGGTPGYTYSWNTGDQSTGIVLGNETQYEVTVIDANGCVATKIYSTVGVDDLIKDAELKIYPNPLAAGNALIVELGQVDKLDATVQVYDNTGRLVKTTETAGSSSIELETANFQSGIYIIRVTGDKLNMTRKLIVY